MTGERGGGCRRTTSSSSTTIVVKGSDRSTKKREGEGFRKRTSIDTNCVLISSNPSCVCLFIIPTFLTPVPTHFPATTTSSDSTNSGRKNKSIYPACILINGKTGR